jgi:hypothetical protein
MEEQHSPEEILLQAAFDGNIRLFRSNPTSSSRLVSALDLNLLGFHDPS